MKYTCFISLLLLLLPVLIFTLLSEENIQNLYLNHGISDEQLYNEYRTWNDFPVVVERDIVTRYTVTVADSIDAPFFLYIPPDYCSSVKSPLIVFLHGGVNRENFIPDYQEVVLSNPFMDYAKTKNFLLLFPSGKNEIAWWSEMGMVNIINQIISIKEKYNVDDDRVFLTGFSDGASASFHFALTAPCVFASFYPMSGNAAVGSSVTGTTAFPRNLRNRFIRAVNTDNDSLYPASKMFLIMNFCISEEAIIHYNTYFDIGHTFDYHNFELPSTMKSMTLNPRNPFKTKLYWETASVNSGSCDWISITAIDTLKKRAEWHEHSSLKVADDRVLFGFVNDQQYEDTGVMIQRVSEDTPSYQMGLSPGDVIIAMDGKNVGNIEELLIIRDGKQRGEDFYLTVMREGDIIELPGRFPPVEDIEVFPERQVPAAVKAVYVDNTFRILTSRVASLRIKISPDMVNLKAPIRVFINDKKYFEGNIEIDRKLMTRNFASNKDRTALWINTIEIDIQE